MRVEYIQAHKLIQANSVLPKQHFEEITAWKDMLVGVMSIAIRNVLTYHKLHFSNFLFGIYSKDAWLMAEGISPSLETWSRTWFALNDKIAHICLLIPKLNKLGSSSWFIIVLHQSSQCDAYLRRMICSDCNWHLRCTDSCCDNLLHVRPALIWSIGGSSDLMHAADQAKTLCWIRATFGMSCFFACSCGCQEFCKLEICLEILSFVGDGPFSPTSPIWHFKCYQTPWPHSHSSILIWLAS